MEAKFTPIAHMWETGVIRRLPWMALAALTATLCFGAAAAVVLWLSDGQNTQSWFYVSPSVLLAICTMLANACLGFALSEGFVIAWWTQAMQTGPVRRLHDNWSYGTSFFGALEGIFKGSLISLATIAASVVIVDGPLLQRASTTSITQRSSISPAVNITIATHLPFGYTGMDFAGDVGAQAQRPVLTPWSLPVILAYNQGDAITASTASGCAGVCKGIVEGAGLWKDCVLTEERLNFSGTTTDGLLRGKQLFAVEWALITEDLALPEISYRPGYGMSLVEDGMNDAIPEDEPFISMNITWSPFAVNMVRSIYRRHCKLYSATSRYPITIHNDTQDFAVATSSDPTTDSITLNGPSEPVEGSVQNVRKAVANTGLPLKINPDWVHSNSELNKSLYITRPLTYFQGQNDCLGGSSAIGCPVYLTLGGISSAAADLLGANVTGMHALGSALFASLSGALSNQFINYSAEVSKGYYDVFGLATGWNDPTDYIYGVLDQIMFRLALDSAYTDTLQNVSFAYLNDTRSSITEVPDRNTSSQYTSYPLPQELRMDSVQTIQIYQSNYWWLLAAVATMTVSTLLIMTLLFGYWSLGRPTSLSPLELAKAFGAPILAQVESNADAQEIVRATEGRSCRYGEMIGQERLTLQIGLSEWNIVKPQAGRVYE